MKTRGQAAFEYLVIVSMILIFMIPIWSYAVSTQQNTNTELILTYTQNAVNQIVDASNLVYSQGPPAKVRIGVYIPERISNITIINNTIKAEVKFNGEFSDIFAFSTATLNGTIPQKKGNYWIEIEAIDNYVQINRK